MRYLIAEQRAVSTSSRRFFERWIRPSVEPLCDAIERARAHARFYQVSVATNARKRSFQLEQSAFEML